MKGYHILIPLHMSLDHGCDYVVQTARILGKSNVVILYDFRSPLSWKSVFFTKEFGGLIRNAYSILSRRTGVYMLRPVACLPFQRWDWAYRINVSCGLSFLNTILMAFRKKVIIWGFDPVVGTILQHLSARKIVYDCIDYFPAAKYPAEYDLCRRADIIACNSDPLLAKKTGEYDGFRHKMIRVVCGCNTDLFNGPKYPSNFSRKKVAYMGTIDYRVDMRLLEYVIRNNPDVVFNIYGACSKGVQARLDVLTRHANVLYHGAVAKKRLPGLLKGAGVGIIPYNNREPFVRFSHPMKAYEYLGMGIPVVTTAIPALNGVSRDRILQTDTRKQFNEGIRAFLSRRRRHINHYSSVARANSWTAKVSQIVMHLRAT